MIEFRCSHCGKRIVTGDQHAGRQAKCPSCKEPLVVPMPSSGQAPENTSPTVPPKPPPPAKRPRSQDEEDEVLDVVAAEEEEEEEPPRRTKSRRGSGRAARRSRELDEEEEDEEDRPQRKRRKRRRRAGGWAPCPNCGSRDASRVYYTYWGGFIGPLLISTVRCNSCGTTYNGKHGDYNTVRIAIFVGVFLVIGVILAVISAQNQH